MQTANADNFFRTENDIAKSNVQALKSEQIRAESNTIPLKGKIISFVVENDHAWTAESGAVARKVSLEDGKTLQLFKGHSGPVTSIQIYNNFLITGSWDKTIKIWDTTTKELVSDTDAHIDFVKCLLVISSLEILVSGSSDKTIRIWDLRFQSKAPLRLLHVASGHTRPVECLAYDPQREELYSGDSMGRIKIWKLERDEDTSTCRITVLGENQRHRTGVNELVSTKDGLWSASTDCTVIFHRHASPEQPVIIKHEHPVKCISLLPIQESDMLLFTGSQEKIHTFDVSTVGHEEVELLGQTEAHSLDINSIGIWYHGSQSTHAYRQQDVTIITSSLDGMLRKWKIDQLLSPQPVPAPSHKPLKQSILTRDEERELEELLESD
ncbi:hypothetical protein FRB91_003509 [Serendipita sp. 411]|nr:hypothetical protein FRB91_003509 [Serendipita sp. 411]